MNKSVMGKLALVVVLLGAAAFLFVKLSPAREGNDQNCFYYDLAEQKLFVASRTLVPPISGIKGTNLTGMRAIVICADGKPNNPSSRKIAYLEKYSPELKHVMEAVQSGKTSEVPPRGTRQGLIYVKRLSDADWQPVSSPEGEKILNEWNVPDAQGKYPVVCSP